MCVDLGGVPELFFAFGRKHFVGCLHMQDRRFVGKFGALFGTGGTGCLGKIERVPAVTGKACGVGFVVALGAVPLFGIGGVGSEALFNAAMLKGDGNYVLPFAKSQVGNGKLLRFQGRNALFPYMPAGEIADALVGGIVHAVGVGGAGVGLFFSVGFLGLRRFGRSVCLAFALLLRPFAIEVGAVPNVHGAVVILEAHGCFQAYKVCLALLGTGNGVGHGELVYPGV